jgi:hypothetical protein
MLCSVRLIPALHNPCHLGTAQSDLLPMEL